MIDNKIQHGPCDTVGPGSLEHDSLPARIPAIHNTVPAGHHALNSHSAYIHSEGRDGKSWRFTNAELHAGSAAGSARRRTPSAPRSQLSSHATPACLHGSTYISCQLSPGRARRTCSGSLCNPSTLRGTSSERSESYRGKRYALEALAWCTICDVAVLLCCMRLYGAPKFVEVCRYGSTVLLLRSRYHLDSFCPFKQHGSKLRRSHPSLQL